MVKSRKAQGFTLIEVLIALAILAMAVGPLLGMMVQASRTNALAAREQGASLAARNAMENLYGLDYQELFAWHTQPWADGTLEVTLRPTGAGDIHWIVSGPSAYLVVGSTLVPGNAADLLEVNQGAGGYSWRWGQKTGRIANEDIPQGRLTVWCVSDRDVRINVTRDIWVQGCVQGGAIACTPAENLTVTEGARTDGLIQATIIATPTTQAKPPASPVTLEAVLRVPFVPGGGR